MKEISGNIWDYHKQGYWIAITTNGTVKKNGESVMGRGIARQAALKFPQLPKQLGKLLKTKRNRPFVFEEYRIVSFPTKHNWWEKSDIDLIEESCLLVKDWGVSPRLYMVRPGCSNGKLDWKDVKPILEKHLDDRFIIVEIKP